MNTASSAQGLDFVKAGNPIAFLRPVAGAILASSRALERAPLLRSTGLLTIMTAQRP